MIKKILATLLFTLSACCVALAQQSVTVDLSGRTFKYDGEGASGTQSLVWSGLSVLQENGTNPNENNYVKEGARKINSSSSYNTTLRCYSGHELTFETVDGQPITRIEFGFWEHDGKIYDPGSDKVSVKKGGGQYSSGKEPLSGSWTGNSPVVRFHFGKQARFTFIKVTYLK